MYSNLAVFAKSVFSIEPRIMDRMAGELVIPAWIQIDLATRCTSSSNSSIAGGNVLTTHFERRSLSWMFGWWWVYRSAGKNVSLWDCEDCQGDDDESRSEHEMNNLYMLKDGQLRLEHHQRRRREKWNWYLGSTWTHRHHCVTKRLVCWHMA